MAEGSPFAGLALAPPAGEMGIELAEREPTAKLVLRGDAADPAFVAAVEESLGLKLPRVVGQGVEGGGIAMLCRGPDEWRVLGAGERADGMVMTEGCALDLDDLASGHGRESQLGPVHVVVRRCDAGFDLMFRRSHARAAWTWLVDAAGEYRLRWTPS